MGMRSEAVYENRPRTDISMAVGAFRLKGGRPSFSGPRTFNRALMRSISNSDTLPKALRDDGVQRLPCLFFDYPAT